LNARAPISKRMGELVTEIGKRIEFHRASFNKESVGDVSLALDELYQLSGVTAGQLGQRVQKNGGCLS
jgi:hypothetical protein